MLNKRMIFIMGLVGLGLISSAKSAQADTPIGGWKRISRAQVTTQQAANYYTSKTNGSVITPGEKICNSISAPPAGSLARSSRGYTMR